MRKIPLLGLLFVFFFAAAASMQAQQLDAAFGVFTLTAPSNNSIVTNGTLSPQSIGGGAFPAFSADYLWKNHLGVQAEVAWRAKMGIYGGYEGFRPILYDVNAMYAPYLGKKVELELLGGIGSQSTRFYNGQYTCSAFSCTDYTSSNHLMGHVGGGVRLYVFNRFFVRPEAHAYFTHNNFEFNSSHEQRYGISIGYSFGTSD
jgi:hypothetical protein